MQARLTFQVEGGAMALVRGFVTDFATRNAMASEEQSRILIVLEELLTNVEKFGYRNRPAGSAEVVLELEGTRLKLEFTDDGDPFDPMQAPPPELDAPLEERGIGGLGIYLVRALADELHYSRVGERNVLQLTRRVVLVVAS
jgi:serine/threonine-protein kinase RsbW